MRAQQIAERLDGRKSGAGWECRCPIHEGHHLKVSDKNGKVLVHCFGGAEQRDVIAALRGEGLWDGE